MKSKDEVLEYYKRKVTTWFNLRYDNGGEYVNYSEFRKICSKRELLYNIPLHINHNVMELMLQPNIVKLCKITDF